MRVTRRTRGSARRVVEVEVAPAPRTASNLDNIELAPEPPTRLVRDITGPTASRDGMEDVDSESPERQEPPLEQRQGIPASENQLGSRISLRENYVDDGATFSLTARVQGVPTPEILWYRSGKRLKSTMSAKMTSLDDSYSLYIAEARVEKDAGE